MNHDSKNDDPAIGLLAGWGQFPLLVAKRLRQDGRRVVCCGIRGHADEQLAELCDNFRWVGLCRARQQVSFFRRHGVTRATMAGKVFKTRLFRRFGWITQLPDLLCMRYFIPHFITRTRSANDDALLNTCIQLYADQGIEFGAATEYAPQLLVESGVLAGRLPTESENRDIEFGWQLAKLLGQHDVGQTVIVKNGFAIAVEAIEGTDACIKRAGELCSNGGFTMVKVAKPQQDMRFDVPTIGLQTVQNLHAAGGRTLAIEAGKTIILDEAEVIAFARRKGLKIVAR